MEKGGCTVALQLCLFINILSFSLIGVHGSKFIWEPKSACNKHMKHRLPHIHMISVKTYKQPKYKLENLTLEHFQRIGSTFKMPKKVLKP